MKKAWIASLLLGWAALAAAETWRFAVVGDTPYSSRERQEFPRMLDAIAGQNVDAVIHVGDIKGGRDRCDDALFLDRRAMFDASRAPFVYVPGDNEWTDCRRVSNGAYDPLERLGRLRALFWKDEHSLGRKRLRLERQPGMPEHSRFRLGPVLLVTLNVPGSDNNWGMGEAPDPEFVRRNPAVLDWLREGFALARREKLAGIVVVMQANPDFPRFNQGLGHRGFRDLLTELRRETLDFAGQVVLVHGDTHHHRIDQPLRDEAGQTIARFMRVESYGYPFMGWVRGVIDPDAPALFRFDSHPWPPARP